MAEFITIKSCVMEYVKSDIIEKYIFERRLICREQLLPGAEANEFKRQLLSEIKTILKWQGDYPAKKWLKSRKSRRLFNIPPGTLHTHRRKGNIPQRWIGGLLNPGSEDIQKIWESLNPEQKIH